MFTEDAQNPDAPSDTSRTVLLVEDKADVLTVCRMLLEDMGYNVITAESAEEALDVYDSPQENIDLVITDMVMPGMTGIELCNKLTNMDPAANVVLMSGYEIDENDREEVPAAVTGILKKPFDRDGLSQVLADSVAA